MSFVHLHTHTEYSLLDGSNKIREYIARCRELGMTAAAITDHGVMYGVIDFYKEALANDIKPVLGCEVYVAPGSRFERQPGESEDRYYHLILLAENNTGYQNLSHIVSRGFTEGYYYKPRVDYELLNKYHEGLICLSACLQGEVARALTRGSMDMAREAAEKYDSIFGHGNFFLELQDHGYPEQRTVNAGLMTLSKELDIPLVATNDCHYTYAEDAEAHDILLCIQTAKKVTDEDRMRYEGGQFYVKSEEEMRSLFPYAQEAIDNTALIAERCNVEIELGKTKLPHYEVPEGYDSWTYLNHLCDEGLKLRYPEDDGTIREKMDFELSVIKRMGYVDYFLIVWDYINYCRENDIAVGPGRGSAAGSIVSYCLKITNIDPVRYDLFFERFLNPERVSMPDIDVDFEYERRQEVIDYVTGKYGPERVVQIITFGTLAARGVIRDVARAMDMPYSRADQVAKMVPMELNMTLERAVSLNPELRKLMESDAEIGRLMEYCRKLEGLPRHSSTHAAGVVICSAPAEDLIPLARTPDGNVTTQFPMTTVEELGLLKMDFLGLRTLTVIKDAVAAANRENRCLPGDPGFIDIDAIDYNDAGALELIASGRTDGVFQLESAGMQSFMRDLKPTCLEDIIAGISLYRPGPMDSIPKYVAAKNSAGKITYETPELEPILSPTYGCIVYQEQVMQIVQQLGGYTLGRADLVRRAMSKKKQHVMEVERDNFINGNAQEKVPGCVAKGISKEIAGNIFDDMMDFAKYAFNKAHAACYAVVCMQTAWLKRYYPAEFMAALMTSFMDNTGKVAGYIGTCRNMGIDILPPDVNRSMESFSVEFTAPDADEVSGIDVGESYKGKAIRYALMAIKGVGGPASKAVVGEREEHGLFTDLNDFLTRISGAEGVNRRDIESFIKSGALDSFGDKRSVMMAMYPRLMDEISGRNKGMVEGQLSLFDMVPDEMKKVSAIRMPDIPEFPKKELLAMEKEVMGIYVSGHPMQEEESLWKRNITALTTDFYLDPETGHTGVSDKQNATVGGIVVAKTTKYTKSDKLMAFVTIEDLYGSMEVIVFPNQYERSMNILDTDAHVLIRGHVTVEEDKDAKLIADEIVPFDELPRKIWIQFEDMSAYEEKKDKLTKIFDISGGRDEVIIYIKATRQMNRKAQAATLSYALLSELKAVFGDDNVKAG